MRSTHRCPKCSHEEIIYLPQIMCSGPAPGIVVAALAGVFSLTEHGIMEAYICKRCGFTELYARNPAEIPLDKIDGARLIRPQ